MIQRPLLLLIVFTLISFPIQAQYSPMAIEQAHWKIHIDDLSTLWEDLKYEYVSRGDTVVEGEAYKKVYLRGFRFDPEPRPAGHYPFPYEVSGEVLYGLIRDDSLARRVYARLLIEQENPYCPIGPEFLLYDFGVQVGDTLKGYCLFLGQEEVVNGIEEAQPQNNFYRTFSTSGGRLIEGIGSQNGLFEIALINVSGFGGGLYDYCVGTDEQCNIRLTSRSHVQQSGWEVSVSPNPAKGPVLIETSQAWTLLRLVDLQGRLVLEKRRPGFQDEIAGQAPGMYVLELRFADGKVVRKKVMWW